MPRSLKSMQRATYGKKKGATTGGAGPATSAKGKVHGLTATPANSAAKNPNPSPAPPYGGPKSGRPVKNPPPYQGTGSKGKGKGTIYGKGIGGTPPGASKRGGSQIGKAAGGPSSTGQTTRKAAKAAYKGKNFKAAWKGYKTKRVSTKRKPLGKGKGPR